MIVMSFFGVCIVVFAFTFMIHRFSMLDARYELRRLPALFIMILSFL
jgi:hypothetical protein